MSVNKQHIQDQRFLHTQVFTLHLSVSRRALCVCVCTMPAWIHLGMHQSAGQT